MRLKDIFPGFFYFFIFVSGEGWGRVGSGVGQSVVFMMRELSFIENHKNIIKIIKIIRKSYKNHKIIKINENPQKSSENHQILRNRGEKKEKFRFLATVLGAVSGSFKKGHFSDFFPDFLMISIFLMNFL